MIALRKRAIAGLLVALILPGTVGAADKKKSAPPPAIEKLGWLAGSWRMEKNNRVIDEQWMVPAGGLMLGMERTVMKGKVVEHEFLQVREGPGGALFFIMQAAGQKEAAFQISSLTENAAVFENQLQEFPQKISYALQPDGSVLVALEGPGADGQPKRVDYAYRRVRP